jgi:adenine-specific DNA-methyltransferase
MGKFGLLDQAENVRRQLTPRIGLKQKSELGQFMTPAPVARFMASLFPPSRLQTCLLLDAGAGLGALSCAFLDRWAAGEGLEFEKTELEAYEIDGTLCQHLDSLLDTYTKRLSVAYRIVGDDFILSAALQTAGSGRFTHAILNPPYRKITSGSDHRLILRQAGIETVNLYSAFVALTLALMKPGGQVVAIVPRSFCNGPYYRPFREFLLAHSAIRHLHLFASRTEAFKDDEMLQENIVIRLERGGAQGRITVSTSTDESFSDFTTHEHPFDRIVFPDDTKRFIHVPTSPGRGAIERMSRVRFSLADVGVAVSTGPVVDFRLQEHIEPTATLGTVPLLYPGILSSMGRNGRKLAPSEAPQFG